MKNLYLVHCLTIKSCTSYLWFCQLRVNILENCSTWEREEEGEHEEKRRGKIEGFFSCTAQQPLHKGSP